MQLKAKGRPHMVGRPIVGPVTRNYVSGSGILLVDELTELEADLSSFDALIIGSFMEESIDMPSVHSTGSLAHLSEGDIVVVHSDGTVNTLYRVSSMHNALLFTERCNSNCLMCSQPPKNRDDAEYLYSIYTDLIRLIPKDCLQLGITGGEPTLLGDKFFKLVQQMQEHLPTTDIHCLTNGRSFAWHSMADRLGNINHTGLMLGIPLYSDYYQQHDYIVQARDAFNQTMQGLYNLARYNQRIEIRVVLHKQTIPRLVKLAKFIYKNLPFVEHVAFMGLEYQGYTPHNIEILWTDPVEYMKPLEEAVLFLADQGMSVSIYNSQLCLMPAVIWPFSRKSISDWKNSYLPQCDRCIKRDDCAGFFSWNMAKQQESIVPII